MKQSAFNPKDLRPVKDLCHDGTIPFHSKSAERLCRTGAIPAIKVGNRWCTTKDAARGYFWRRANKAFRESHC
jgi:hypothetical protein